MKKTKITVPDADMKVLERAMHHTWAAIAADVEPGSNTIMCEVVLDSDYMEMYGREEGKQARVIVSRLYEQFSYNSVLKFIASKIRLV